MFASGIKLSQSFKWKWPKSFAGFWQHLLGTDKKNSKNGAPSLSFFIFIFFHKAYLCDACLYCFDLQSPLLSRGLCHYRAIFKRFCVCNLNLKAEDD
jgi:hypothetical protein